MAWKTSSVMDEKLRFVFEYERDEQTMSQLCASYGVSRETGYVWLRRFGRYGVTGLVELNRAPRHASQPDGRSRWSGRCWNCARRTCAGDRAS